MGIRPTLAVPFSGFLAAAGNNHLGISSHLAGGGGLGIAIMDIKPAMAEIFAGMAGDPFLLRQRSALPS
jgi:hypothetical protein